MKTEDTLLLDCLRWSLDPGQYPQPTLPIVWDERAMFRTAQLNRAMSALQYVEKNAPGFWPVSFSKHIQTSRYSFLIYAEEAVVQVQLVLAELARAGIHAVVLKGWEYIYTVYAGDYSLRPCGDIDILVPPGQARRAEAVLGRCSFMPWIELWPGFRFRHHNAAHHYGAAPEGKPDFAFGVDLHWGLFNLPYQDGRVRLEEVFKRSVGLKIEEVGAYRLCAEDHILHACGHLFLHHDNQPGLFRFYELAWVICRTPGGVDWSALFQRAAEWRLQIPLLSTLNEMERLFPGTLPAEAAGKLAILQPEREEKAMYELLMKYRDTPFVHLLPLRWTPAALWEAACYLFEAFVPGPRFLEQRYGRSRFWPLHYLRRGINAVKQLISFRQKS